MILLLLSAALLPAQQDSSRALRVDTIVTEAMAERRIPGVSIAVVNHGRIVLQREYGQASVELEAPVRPGSVYLIASITKTFTALGIMMLAQDGKLSLDSTIAAYLGPVPAGWSGITVRQLLTHTAGLKDRFEIAPNSRFFMAYTTRQMRERAEATPVDFPAGTRFQYSDQGYFLLGLIIEAVSGKTYRQFLSERIFQPAGMTASTTHNPYELVKGRVPTYLLQQGRITPAQRGYSFGLVSHYGVMSSASDLARYAMALMQGDLVPAATLNQMWSAGRLTSGAPARVASLAYGYGWFLEPFGGHRVVMHPGSTGTALYLAPDDSSAVVVLTNLEQASGSDPAGLARQIAAVYLPWLQWWDAPGRPDPDTAFSTRVKTQLWAVASGRADSTAYTAVFWQSLRPTLPSQRAGLEKLGEPTALIYLSTDTWGTQQLVQWRADYAEASLLIKAIRDGDGRIDYLMARE